MSYLVLGNSDYPRHTTDEGQQLQGGLVASGWSIRGHGFGDGCRDVGELLQRCNPKVVFVQDARDWRQGSTGCYNRDLEFTNIGVLRNCGAVVATVVKDAGTFLDFQRDFAEEIGAHAAVIYYHPQSCLKSSPWLGQYQLIRTWHSVDAKLASGIDYEPRRRALVSGAVDDNYYPIRKRVMENAELLRCDLHRHPGYGNRGCHTPEYLKMLSRYKVHVATSSCFGFSLRKIIESVCAGCTPVTNLPAYDRLPAIDGALIRVSSNANLDEIGEAIDRAEREWTAEKAKAWAEKGWAFYDWRNRGASLSAKLKELA